MKKTEFLTKLRECLIGIPNADLEQIISYYSEMIDDKIEEGNAEEEIIEEIGSPDKVAEKIISELSLGDLVKMRAKTTKKRSALEITLLILGSPIWISLLVAFFAVIFSVWVSLWSVVISLWAAQVSVAITSIAGIVLLPIISFSINKWMSVTFLGVGILLLGISILMFFGCFYTSKGMAILTKKIIICTKKALVGRKGE